MYLKEASGIKNSTFLPALTASRIKVLLISTTGASVKITEG